MQKTNFYIGTRVKALVVKKQVSSFALLFLANQIDKQSVKFSYGYNACGNLNILKIMLPTTKSGNPDYEFMENYIKYKMFEKYNEYLNFIPNSD